MHKLSIVFDEIKLKAQECEGLNHWCWAAILWLRVGETEEAEQCEFIAVEVALEKAPALSSEYNNNDNFHFPGVH